MNVNSVWHWCSFYSTSCCSMLAAHREHRKKPTDYPKGQLILCPPSPPKKAVLGFKGPCDSFATRLQLATLQTWNLGLFWFHVLCSKPLWFLWQRCIIFWDHKVTWSPLQRLNWCSKKQAAAEGLNYCLVVSKGRLAPQSICYKGLLSLIRTKALVKLRSYTSRKMPEMWSFTLLQERRSACSS